MVPGETTWVEVEVCARGRVRTVRGVCGTGVGLVRGSSGEIAVYS